MARKYDTTRFTMVTVVNLKTVDDSLNIVDETMLLDGFVQREDAEKQATKKYGKAIITGFSYSGTMYGLTTEEVIRYGHPLNPYTRQPWADDDDKEALTKKYILEKVLKVEGFSEADTEEEEA